VVSAGFTSTRVLKSDGILWAWGQDEFGLMDSTTHWRQLTAGLDYTLAIKYDGTLWAWGKNNFGQLGDGTNADRSLPTQMGLATDWWQVSAGLDHTLAVKNDGSIWAWGKNLHGQLGDGTTIDRNTPVQISAASDWQHVAAGYEHSMALKTNGELWAWGSNEFGQLGNGTNLDSKIPVEIPCALSSAGDLSLADIDLKISPNPVQNYLRIRLPATIPTIGWTYEIRNMLGVVVNTRQHLPVDREIGVEKLAKGNYILIVDSKAGQITRRFVKM
ncbi:MAG: T9SS type A sorting domain-containing protein, partial [Saprospiraceae bacterium]